MLEFDIYICIVCLCFQSELFLCFTLVLHIDFRPIGILNGVQFLYP